MKELRLIALAGVIVVILGGCSQDARDQYGAAGKDATDATKNTGKAISTDAANSKTAADNTLQTTKVMSALKSAAGLDTTHINVDSDTKARTITLHGSVPDGKQKEQAETVAKGVAGSDFTVVNNLNVVSN